MSDPRLELKELEEADRRCAEALALDPNHVEALHHRGVIALSRGRPDIAVDLIGRAIALNGTSPECHYNIGIALGSLGRFSEAEFHNRRAIELKPDHALAHLNLGNALKAQGRTDEAARSYERALEIAPRSPQAHYNLANILSEQRRFEPAILHYRRATELNPQYADAYNNAGTAHDQMGRIDEAISLYHRALTIQPRLQPAYVNLGDALHRKGDLRSALDCARRALSLAETSETKILLFRCMSDSRAAPYLDPHRDILVRALTEPWGQPAKLASGAAELVARDPAVAEAIARNDRTWGERPIESIGPAGIGALTDEPLFRSIMLAGRVSHAGLERLLTRLRASLLELAAQTNASAPEDEALVAQASTLARLCFLNEYVFSHSEQEIEQLGRLRAALAEHVRDGVPVPALWLAVIGAYCSLDELDAADTLLTRSWPEPVQVLLRQQIHEPRAVRACTAEIGQLTPIDDRVSLAVQRQYEENPYPRWERFTTLQSPQPFQAYLRGLFPQRNIQIAAGERKLDYLIAGCGTGQHVAMIAQRISDVRVTAVDLSRASLGYAKHMTAGLGEIDYAQADILKLESISNRFDVIDCAGVLHHLEDWQAGWRALLSILRPRGLMQLGFYSELARRPVTEARRQIAERGFRGTTDDIRRFRRESLWPLADSPIASELAKSWDFYSVSDCRDLLFHVQEHQLNLPQIGKFLSEHKLDLLGFSLDSAVLQQYRQQFPADEGQSNISNWHVFEQQHPNTFAGMYQFWVQRQT